MSLGGFENELPPELLSEAVGWRRQIHQYPELAFEEWKTADFIASQLTQWGFAVHRGLGGTGVVGSLRRGTSARSIGIRADMDALPMDERSEVAHASKVPGAMHACGHDGHVAIALAAAKLCSHMPGLDGTAHFIFQPAEEGDGGARCMIEEGLFRLFPCDAVYALHNWPALPLGSCVARDGYMMAAVAIFEITISGQGCHAAMPQQGTDCILAGSQLVMALQSIISRDVDPLEAGVLSVTQVHSGEAYNVLPDRCLIRGTTRWFGENVGERLERRIRELAQAIARGFGCVATVHYQRRFPATVNDPAAANVVRSLASGSSRLTVVDAQPSMGAEDFAFMLKAVPGCYVWLGSAGAQASAGLHSPQYDFNDELMPIGIELWVNLVREALSGPT